MGVFVEVGKGGTVKETVGVTSEVQVGSSVLVGKGVKVSVGVMVVVGGKGVAVLDGIITSSGKVGVGNSVLQAVASRMHPGAMRPQKFFIFLTDALTIPARSP